MISSTPLRKSLNKKQNEFPGSPVVDEVNDDHERRNRRSVYDVEVSLSNIPDSSNASSKTIDQVIQHIKMCQKLCNENKINTRNAWDVKVIDYIHHYVTKNMLLDSEVILEGARTLEVCVKVYGCKVEYLGQEIVKLVSTKEAESANNRDNSFDGDENDGQNGTVSNKTLVKKKKRKHARATVVKDKNDILAKEIPKVVPIDFVGNIDVYANNHQNMATNKTPMDHAGYKFNLLNNVDRGFIFDGEKDVTLLEKIVPNIPLTISLVICPEFKNFNVDEEDHAYNDSIADIINDSVRTRLPENVVNQVVYDDDGAPIPELDGSIHDVFEDNPEPIEFEESETVAGQAAQRRIEMITSFCPADVPPRKTDSMLTSKLNGSNGFLEMIWVGPSHWKNKLIRQSVPRYSGKADEKVTQARKKKKTSIRPEQRILDLDATQETSSNKLCRPSVTQNIKKWTLPLNQIYTLFEADEFMSRKLVQKCEYQSDKKESEFEHSPYDYNNADDSEYCSQIELPDINHNVIDGENNLSTENIQNSKITNGGTELELHAEPLCFNRTDALIDAPDMVTQVYIPYALRAKNVNMKKLKIATWQCLTKDSNINESALQEEPIQSSTFSDVLKKLPSKLPKKSRSEVSTPLAFFSLLHLANEHNLNLTGNELLNDITIV